jgi:hypothetical protein
MAAMLTPGSISVSSSSHLPPNESAVWLKGQRKADLLRMPWSAFDGARISLRQGKARRGEQLGPLVEIHCTAGLRRTLDGTPRVSPLILTTKTGQSFKKRYFARLWDETMKKGRPAISVAARLR